MTAAWALTRAISSSLQDAELCMGARQPIDVELARRQHAAYVQALRDAGLDVQVLPELTGFPDCCFVEDCAVIANGAALITRPGADSRRGEVESVASALLGRSELFTMASPATLDGGDVMRVGHLVFVGLTARTNREGTARLREVFEPRGLHVHVVKPPPSVLHLKCVCSPLDERTALVAAGVFDRDVFEDIEVVEVPAAEAYAANAVVVNGTALVAAGFRETRRILEGRGLKVVELDMSETRKADGSLTCLSVLG